MPPPPPLTPSPAHFMGGSFQYLLRVGLHQGNVWRRPDPAGKATGEEGSCSGLRSLGSCARGMGPMRQFCTAESGVLAPTGPGNAPGVLTFRVWKRSLACAHPRPAPCQAHDFNKHQID